MFRTIRQKIRLMLQGASTGNETVDEIVHHIPDYEYRAKYLLFLSLILGLIFAVYHLVVGVISASFWMGALGIYYAVLAFMKYYILRPGHPRDETAAWRVYRRTAFLLNLLVLTMSGVFVQMVIMNQAHHYQGVTIYAVALWAFVKIISATVNLIRRRKDHNPILAAARCVSIAGASMSLLGLQTALIAEFGEDAREFARTMNTISGAVVSAGLVTLAAFMIARSQGKAGTEV